MAAIDYQTQLSKAVIECPANPQFKNMIPDAVKPFELFDILESSHKRLKWAPKSSAVKVLALLSNCYLVDASADFPDCEPFYIRVAEADRTVTIDHIYSLPAYVLVFGAKDIREFLM